MKGYLRRLTSDSEGSASVDWIVLTGLAVGLTISVMALVASGAEQGGSDLLAPASITTEF